jgi:hypothetical protein
MLLVGFQTKKVGISTDLSYMAPPKIQFSNHFKEDLQKIYQLKPLIDVKVIDFPKVNYRKAVAI